ncbi:5-oxoprolinase subunit PxpB [Desulfosoma caldarium]|uniref:KipI family sensor histidine kinase inhibitor n=1 Tax=Desulfosoma caldarium TaxID=610254 RepID=A0A3N1VPN8_9BACT|nr:5-oxoprolinase subunit PxpB [Desulfosoma caldarium]ROR02998.1 KipI family sensor histidine kinase inhibitor [Desulfosoma caldarium]
MSLFPRFRHCGETALSVELGEGIDMDVNRRVHALHGALKRRPLAGILSMNPTYRSLFIHYDPALCSFERLMLTVQELLEEGGDAGNDLASCVDIPVCYGGELGPDLPDVAAFHGLTEDEVVRRHTAATYHVYMIGFTPGFPYLGGLDGRIATPRKKTPRPKVPAGSVGIAEKQTGIYPIESPGGWQIIGRTPLKLFDVHRDPPFLVEAGMQVRFYAISREEYEDLAY